MTLVIAQPPKFSSSPASVGYRLPLAFELLAPEIPRSITWWEAPGQAALPGKAGARMELMLGQVVTRMRTMCAAVMTKS